MNAQRLMKTPPINWEKVINKMSQQQRDELRRELEGIAERASFLSGYLDERAGYGCGDQGHDAAVKEANKRGKMVWMKVFGYNGYHEMRF